jgi:hypothetical protein
MSLLYPPFKPLIKRCDKYQLLNCPKCNLITCTPLPTPKEIKKYYKGYLFNLPTEIEATEKEQTITKNISKIINDIQEYKPEKGKLLDIGDSTGLYSQAFAKYGYNVTLIYIDPQSCTYVKKIWRSS